jgi:hypothetical protein
MSLIPSIQTEIFKQRMIGWGRIVGALLRFMQTVVDSVFLNLTSGEAPGFKYEGFVQ